MGSGLGVDVGETGVEIGETGVNVGRFGVGVEVQEMNNRLRVRNEAKRLFIGSFRLDGLMPCAKPARESGHPYQ